MSTSISDVEFAHLWNNTHDYPTIQDLADDIGSSYDAVRYRARKLKLLHFTGEFDLALINRGLPERIEPTIGDTENDKKDKTEYSRDELLEELRGLARDNPERTITRNFFREQTGLYDSSWSKYFGTFFEFKRQAGVESTAAQRKLERSVARHSEHDHYRVWNERHDYAAKYRKTKGTRLKTIVGIADLHDIEVDPFYLRVLIETCKMVQPDVINLGGDIFDLPEFGRFTVDPREWDVVGRIKFVHDNILAPLREICPESQIDFVEGNHEFRLLRHLADMTPALKAVLSDLLGLTIPKILGLDKYEVNYIAKADLAAFNVSDQRKEVERSYVVYDDTVMVHHHPHARDWGLPGWNGHEHAWKVFHMKNALHGSYQWMQLGCGHRLRASYCEGEFWTLGFNICHYNIDTKSVLHEYVNVTDFACVGGYYFHRTPEEMIGNFAQ